MRPPFWHSRDDLPMSLNELSLFGVGVEVGTQRGVFASYVRTYWLGAAMICVDPWVPYAGSPTTAEQHVQYMREAGQALRRAAQENGGREWTLFRKASLEAAKQFASHNVCFDWVYLDGNHAYEEVKADIAAWWPLVKSGGLFAGHDWVVDGWHRNDEPLVAYATEAEAGVNNCGPFGVRRAVDEFVREHDLTSRLAVTQPTTDGGWQSWAVVKP